MPGKAVSPALTAELQRQFNQELGAAHGYLAMAAWCELENFKGFARYFRKQAGEERLHADRFLDHMIDRRLSPEFGPITAPPSKFGGLIDVAKLAQKMERANTAGIHASYEAAVKEHDYPAQVLLHWFITEQVEEESWSDEMVERVEAAACAGASAELDRHIERYLSEHSFQPADAAP